MKILKVENSEPAEYSIRQLRKDNPNVSFPKEPDPDTLAEYGVFPFTEEPIESGARKGFVKTSDGWVMEWSAPDPAEVLQAKREDASMSREAFAIKAAKEERISDTEAEEWAASAAIPAKVLTVIESLPADAQLEARIAVRMQPVIRRTADLMPGIGAEFGMDADALDKFFGIEP